MPELPDLQVFSKNLDKTLKGKTLQKISINSKRIKTSAVAFNKTLAGRKLKKVYREGKQLRLLFDDDALLGIHLMLHGKLVLFQKQHTEKNSVATLLFDDDTGLAVTDFQGAAQLTLNPEESEAPDALSSAVNAAFLKKIFGEKHKQVKELLLDQHVIRGIGNAYADEILWQAKLSPFSYTDKIPAANITKLATAIKKVLKDAEKKILKSNPGIIAGEVRDFMLVHNSKKEKSPGGKPILTTSAKSRKTYYTEEQELFK